MSGSVPLRLWCMAAMAPALTEAGSHTGIKLPTSPPTAIEGVNSVNGSASLPNGHVESHVVNGHVRHSNEPVKASVKLEQSFSEHINLPKTINTSTSVVKSTGLLSLGSPAPNNGASRKVTQVQLARLVGNSYNIKSITNLALIKNLPDIYRPERAAEIKFSSAASQTRLNSNTYSVMNPPLTKDRKSSEMCHDTSSATQLITEPGASGDARPIPHSRILLSALSGCTPSTHTDQRLANDVNPQGDHTSLLTSVTDSSTSSIEHQIHTLEKTNILQSDTITNLVNHLNLVRSFTQRQSQSLENEPNKSIKPVESRVTTRSEIKRNHLLLENRAQCLQRRLRRLQGRQLESHTVKQLGGLVEHQHKNSGLSSLSKSDLDEGGLGFSHDANNAVSHLNLQSLNPSACQQSAFNKDRKTDLLTKEDVKSLSTAALVSLVQKLQSTHTVNSGTPSLSIASTQLSLVNSASTKTTRVSSHKNRSTKFDVFECNAAKTSPSVHVHSLDKQLCSDSDKFTGQLTAYLDHVLPTIDSEATESSSGGESDSDTAWTKEKKKHRHAPSLQRRADWKWAVERAAAASRWTWLQAQVSDLEYRIRQQSDIYRQIRANKGTVVLGDPAPPLDLMSKIHAEASLGHRTTDSSCGVSLKTETSPACNISTVLSNVDKQSSKLTKSLGNCLSPTVSASLGREKDGMVNNTNRTLNGYLDSPATSSLVPSDESEVDSPALSSHSRLALEISPVVDDSCQAARCRPLKSYRKRKLLRTCGLHQISRKAARLSSVKCHCYPPFTPCAMCGGRYNNTRTIDSSTMTLQERVSLLELSFHPVLSFWQDVSLQVHIDALLKSGAWQRKNDSRSNKSGTGEKRKYRRRILATVQDHARKQSKKLSKNATALLASSKLIKRPYKRRALPGSAPPRANSTLTIADGTRLRYRKRKSAKLALAAMQNLHHHGNGSMSGRSGSHSRSATPSLQDTTGLDRLALSASSSSLFKDLKDPTWRKRAFNYNYDINNIVIPYSMAASTRVEKLQYKEIVTPKWRCVDDSTAEEATTNESKDIDDQQEEEVEDISDEAVAHRHLQCEIQEKKRFINFIQYGRRSRGSRTDSGGLVTPDPISGGLVTPDPISPDFAFGAAVDSQFPNVHMRGDDHNVYFRRRSSSISNRRESVLSDDAFLHTPNHTKLARVMDPWNARVFPISAAEYTSMLQEQPSIDDLAKKIAEEAPALSIKQRATSRSNSGSSSVHSVSNLNLSIHGSRHSSAENLPAMDNIPVEVDEEDDKSKAPTPVLQDDDFISNNSVNNSRLNSPAPSSSSRSYIDDENDPEWTVVSEKPSSTSSTSSVTKHGIVLKLSRT